MKVLVTGRAKREIARVALWWSRNRPDAPLLFVDELEEAALHLCTAPISGQVYGYRRNRAIRRWLLQETDYHVYFTVNREAQSIVLHSVWNARRGQGPKL